MGRKIEDEESALSSSSSSQPSRSKKSSSRKKGTPTDPSPAPIKETAVASEEQVRVLTITGFLTWDGLCYPPSAPAQRLCRLRFRSGIAVGRRRRREPARPSDRHAVSPLGQRPRSRHPSLFFFFLIFFTTCPGRRPNLIVSVA